MCALTGFWVMILTCGSSCRTFSGVKSKKYNIEVTVSDALKDKSISLCLIGIRKSDKQKWEKLNVDDPWSSQLVMEAHKDQKMVMKLGHQQEESKILRKKDQKWKNWKKSGFDHIALVANIPRFKKSSFRFTRWKNTYFASRV